MTEPQKARWATALLFAVDGIGFGVWAAHIAVFKETLHLSSISLSEVLLALVIGSILTMPLAGYTIARTGSRLVIWISASAYILAVAGLGYVDGMVPLICVAAAFGAAKGALDVSVNAQGVWVEQKLGKPIVSSFQGFWSLGGLFGASISSYALRHGSHTHEDFFRTALLLVVCTCAGSPLLLPGDRHEPASEEKPRWRRPDPALLRLAGIAFLGLFAEGAMADWGGVYLKSSVGVSLSQAAIGYAAFAVSMATGRFAGDWLIAKFHPVAILRACGLLLFCGLSFALALNVWWAAIVGFVCTGFGIANIVPVIWGAAGRNLTVGTGPALATVTTVGYFGFLAGPPLIGALATLVTVRPALIIVALFGLAITASSHVAIEATE
ncbi:MFS transporter [Granulicella sp. WH15]|uniref:MFS transporter n=1 Tax=Granulicella sp. WH15 TaxID=2602070 RepID=UPI0013672F65|nr:MFS transporter [Granulicella sp. WH15]QHN04785.1 MFS transporter [Granulicella sp. WH15]